MKKIICICICICLMSGCDKSLSHGRPANAVVEDKGSEGVSPHSLTSDISASKPSNTPAPTPEPSKSAPSSDSAVSSSLRWYNKPFNVASLTAVALTLIFVSGIAVYNKFFGKNNSAVINNSTVIKDKNGTTATIGEDGILHIADKDGNEIELSPFKFIRYLKKILNSDMISFRDILHDAIVRSFIDDDIQFPYDLDYSDYPKYADLSFIFKNFINYAASIFKRSNVISYLSAKKIEVPAE